ncbi:S1C family serine protease [Paenibacillus spongiae]|uniref:Trypsin-like peptidase domain-containing protein n=1 Tax=Paenibacillus spongiae TaxID=2909671 RepID=A0ABY5S5Z4_9BACL|nr:trypsin-like peptidase domain-containing protein [Paenibacillus spongiae]UVI29326.1 trypsin-like peptidase domain-containing protein [Paenibacillus spongiae]
MRKNRLRLLCATAAGALLVTGSAMGAAQAAAPAHSLEAKLINGEVYVKASSLTKALGGTGTYNAKTGTYSYSSRDPIPDVIQNVSPSVVAIIGKPAGYEDRYALSHGTGVVWKADGWIVTNAHVVKDMKNIVVVMADGKQYEGKTTHADEASDLALVKVNATGLKPARFAASPLQLQVGEQVAAIGTPVSFTLRNTATTGILSGMNRSVSSAYKLLQTDAAINPGNSGGPLVNLKGEVIGINSLKFVSPGIESLGFSIPTDTVRYVMQHFFKYGKVNRASLGIELEESWAAIVGLPTTEPLRVTAVKAESASKAGLKAGDLLYTVAGKPVTSLVELNELLKAYLPGQQVEIVTQTGSKLTTRKLVLAQG